MFNANKNNAAMIKTCGVTNWLKFFNADLGQIAFLRSQLATDSTWGRTERIGIIMYGGGGGGRGALS